jgi:hypothetical protein
MKIRQPVFTQVVSLIHPQQFKRCVERYRGAHKVQSFTCWDQFLCMAFAQLTYRESLRDIEACLNSRRELLYHMGFSGPIARSTLADANEARDFRIYADLAQSLIRRARVLYIGEELDIDLTNTVYAIDSSTVTVSLGLYPWARFRPGMAGVKMHTQLDLRGSIPTFVYITAQRVHDATFMDQIIPEPGAVYVMDRAYLSFVRLYRFHQHHSLFVVRARDDFDFVRSTSRPHADSRVRSDQLGHPRNPMPRRFYPDLLRRIHYFDPENEQDLIFVTNMFDADALDIAQLYRYRWHIELFFKWIKQNLRIRAFHGTSLNAVQTQIWIAICVYVMVAIIHKRLLRPDSLHRTLQILSVTPFEKLPLDQLLTEPRFQTTECNMHNQLIFNYL